MSYFLLSHMLKGLGPALGLMILAVALASKVQALAMALMVEDMTLALDFVLA